MWLVPSMNGVATRVTSRHGSEPLVKYPYPIPARWEVDWKASPGIHWAAPSARPMTAPERIRMSDRSPWRRLVLRKAPRVTILPTQ